MGDTEVEQALRRAEQLQTLESLDRMEARIEALQRAVRADPGSPHRKFWLEDLRQARADWLQIVDQAMAAKQAAKGE